MPVDWDVVGIVFTLAFIFRRVARDSCTRLFHIGFAPPREKGCVISPFFFPFLLFFFFCRFLFFFLLASRCCSVVCWASLAVSFERPRGPFPIGGEESCESTFGGLSPTGQSFMGLGSVPMECVQMVSMCCHRLFAYGVVRAGWT